MLWVKEVTLDQIDFPIDSALDFCRYRHSIWYCAEFAAPRYGAAMPGNSSQSAELTSTLATLRDLPTATIYEAAGKIGAAGPTIHAIGEGLRLAGVAFTVKAEPRDNLVLFRSVDAAPPGSVLVIDAGATNQATIWGGTL
ncbi:MAG TPA: hypothetical protein VGM76_19815, partial [Lacipirellulaceae bacterium]